MRICLTGEVEGKEIGYTGGRQHTLELGAKLIGAEGQHRLEAFLLPQRQSVNRHFRTGHFHGNLTLQFFQCIETSGLQFHKYGAVEQRFPVLSQVGKKLDHILEVAFCFDGFVDISATAFQLIAPGGVLDDLSLLHGFHGTVVDPQCNTVAVGQLGQYCLFFCGWRILPDRPCTAIAVTDDIMVCHKPDGGRQNHIEEVLRAKFLCLLRS